MPTATLLSLSEDEIDDLLYLARNGETSDLAAGIDLFAKSSSSTPSTILTGAVDPSGGNGLLHMAAANGHIDTLKQLLSLSEPSHALSLNLQNSSGNTPLHWAALNGYLPAVKILIEAGADPTVLNKAGKDAVYEAEANDKHHVAQWLLLEGMGLDKGAKGTGGEQEMEGYGVEGENAGQSEEVMLERPAKEGG